MKKLSVSLSGTLSFSLLQGNFITTSHYADVVEERMLSKKCGYPLCNTQLNEVKLLCGHWVLQCIAFHENDIQHL